MKSACLALFAVVATTSAALAQSQKVVVPAFFALNVRSDPSKATDWVRIQNAGSAVQIVVALGDTNGFETCGSGTCDANQAGIQFAANHSAGQMVLGYVNSQFATVIDPIGGNNGTGVQAWYSRYGSQIQGIFWDNGPTFDPSQSTKSETAFQNYYEPKYAQIHASPYYWQVMINASQFPGTTATAQPQDWLLAGCPNCSPAASPAADYVLAWEQTQSQYGDASFKAIGPGGVLQSPPNWWRNASYTNQGRISHVVTGLNQWLWNTNGFVMSRNAAHAPPPPASPPSIYLFDGSPKAYSRLSCYFENEVAAVSGQSYTDGTSWCGTHCVDLYTDPQNCSVCNFRCATGELCVDGACTCSGSGCL